MLQLQGTIKGTQYKISKELGFEFLKFRRWFRRLCLSIILDLHKLLSIYSILLLQEITYITPIIRIKLKHYCIIDILYYWIKNIFKY